MKKAFEKITMILMALAIAIGYPGMYFLGRTHAGKSLSTKIDELKLSLASVGDKLADEAAEKANLIASLASAEEVIQQYQAHEECEAVINEIREIDATLFREVSATISYTEQQPYAFCSTSKMISPELVGKLTGSSGYFVDRNETISVTYYYGVLNNDIVLENVNDKSICIKYDANSFMIPYIIKDHETELNTVATLLTDAGDDTDVNCINAVAYNQLSILEDEYIKVLQEKYKNSKVPVFVNGTKLDAFTEKDKKVSKSYIDPKFTVVIAE